MSETKERSAIFKFFYVFLSIITFPVFALLFILRHPVWALIFLALLAGGTAYWPMSRYDVKLSEVVDWYKGQIQTTKFDLAKKALEGGNSDYVPQSVLDEMKRVKEEAEEAKLPKSENYNAKVVRDKKSEDIKAVLKKRGGFKKKGDDVVVAEPTYSGEEADAEMNMPVPQSGGLSALVPSQADEVEVQQNATSEKINEKPILSDEVEEKAVEQPTVESVKTPQSVKETSVGAAEDEMDLF